VGLGREEHDAVREPGRRREVHQSRHLVAGRVRPGGAAHDGEHDVSRRLRGPRHRLGQRADGHVGALQRLEAPDEQQEPFVGQVKTGFGLVLRPRTEHRRVNAGRDDADAVGVGPVQPDQGSGLDRNLTVHDTVDEALSA